jgi:hypothetical protein
VKLEEERRALAAFVSKFDSLGLGQSPVKLIPNAVTGGEDASPVRMGGHMPEASLLEEDWGGSGMMEDMSFETEKGGGVGKEVIHKLGIGLGSGAGGHGKSLRDVLAGKENIFM